MWGHYGKGRGIREYFYYRCEECGFKVPAAEIERVVLERIGVLSESPEILLYW